MQKLILPALILISSFSCQKDGDEVVPTINPKDTSTTDTIFVCKILKYERGNIVGGPGPTTTTWDYDAQDRLIGVKVVNADPRFSSENTNYTHDSEGRVTGYTLTTRNLSIEYKLTYASNGDTALVTIDGIQDEKWEYDSDGHEIYYSALAPSNPSFTEYTNYSYDSRGNLLSYIEKVGSNTPRTFTYTYNEQNQPLTLRNDGGLPWWEWIYDSKGLKIGYKKHQTAGVRIEQKNFIYDENDVLVSFDWWSNDTDEIFYSNVFSWKCKEVIVDL